jgi:hypothetical protein
MKYALSMVTVSATVIAVFHGFDANLASDAFSGEKSVQEAGFSLRRQPFAPRDGFHLTLGQIEPGWELYLAS